VAAQELQLLERQNVVEEEVARVVLVQLHLAPVSVWARDWLVEQFNQHGQVVLEQRVQVLRLLHLFVVEHVARVLVKEEVVLYTEQLDFDDFRALIGTLKEDGQ